MTFNPATQAILQRTQEFIDEANSDNSHGHKVTTLENYPELKPLFKAVYDPQLVYHVRPKSLLKYALENGYVFDNDYEGLQQLLDALSNEEISGHTAIEAVLGFINEYGYEDVILRIFDRNLKVRIKAKLVSKVYPDLFMFFQVALAHSYEDHYKKVDFETQDWWMSRKLDGLRCLAIVDGEGNAEFWSRRGKKFLGGMSILEEEIKRLKFRDCVLDGEICIVDKDGIEDFAAALSEFRSQGHVERPRYYLIDCLTTEEFQEGTSTRLLTERFKVITGILGKSEFISRVPQVKVNSFEHMDGAYNKAVERGWEGLMIRRDVPYEAKRTDKLLKLKPVYDVELPVTGHTMGIIRYISDGVEIEEEMLSSISVDYKGYTVNVGTGFSIEERQHYYKHPELLDNAIGTVMYTNESQDKEGNLSLRFPRLKALFPGERDA
jgi:DNA ligase 1